MPKISSGSTFGSMIVLASQRTPSSSPSVRVDAYSTISLTRYWNLSSPDSRIAIPRNSEKKSGDATGNRNDSSTHATTAKVSF